MILVRHPDSCLGKLGRPCGVGSGHAPPPFPLSLPFCLATGTYDLTLERRTGFVRLAIKHGASLVPIVSFGENDIFKQAKNEQGSRLRRCQEYGRRVEWH